MYHELQVREMWKDFRKKVTDFLYEEIEEEEAETAEIEKQFSGGRKLDRKMDTKVAYEYPKKDTARFRFPLIPDESEEFEEMPPPKLETPRQVRRRSTANKRPQRTNRNVFPPTYQNKKLEKELEEVPAYIRRRQKQEHTLIQKQDRINQKQKQEASISSERNSKNSMQRPSYSRPDELDRVFKLRDGIHDGVMEKVETPKTIDSPLQSEQHRTIEKTQMQERPQNEQVISEQEQREQQEENPIKFHQTDDLSTCQPVVVTPIQETMRYETDIVSRTTLEQDETKEQEHREEILPENTVIHEKVEVPNYLLNDPIELEEDDSEWIEEQQMLLAQTLKHFNIDAKIVQVTQGPSVTRIEIQPALGVKVSKIRNLADDIKLNLAAQDIRIEAPIPGKNTIGIEVPNQFPQVVHLQEMIESEAFKEAKSPLTIALGLKIEGEPLITNIEKMPHGLIAGATGSGKSVCINTILLSLLYKADHNEVKFLLIDPKMVELTPYNGIPHLLAPVITDAKAATLSLKWAVDEMEHRYEQFVEAGVRNIKKYNEKMQQTNGEKLPYIVIVIDELADLMIVSPQEVEDAICRIAQKARAAGIHLLLATQRPSVDVITGLIKANIPTRIAFSVSSQVDSRTIIDSNGAEKLLGKGDMLFVENGSNKSVRLQGPFVSDEEIDRIANYLRSIAEPNYVFEQEQLLIELEHEEEDELFDEVVSFVIEQNQASTSLLQRRFRIGYNRAARLIDTLHQKGIISSQNGSKPRDVLITKSQWEGVE